MHRESITEALLGTVLVFNTVFEIPADMSLPGQIFGAGVVFYILFSAIEKARAWERRKKVRRAATLTDKQNKYTALL